ncbi:unnamed protein product [Cylindrotheca closterium]|uniref:Uncharacterized protein n=1 Tax=Cylindrotheca closterium TaxID=2856 RepID=A0AAD2FM81_9STRA|nr:unnamed protein product [Cylindrotheca closterium]
MVNGAVFNIQSLNSPVDNLEGLNSLMKPVMDLVVGSGSCQCERCCICMTLVGDSKCNNPGDCCDVITNQPVNSTILV